MDPTYVYIKGQGWVVRNNYSITVDCSYGRVQLINRMPEIGEDYIFKAHYASKYFIPGTKELDLSKFNHQRELYIKHRNPGHMFKDWGSYATVVRL